MVNSYDKVVKRLVEYRKRLGWSQEKMCRKLNLSQSYYSRLESGRNVISYEALELLMQCDCDIDLLITGYERRETVLDLLFQQCITEKRAEFLIYMAWVIRNGAELDLSDCFQEIDILQYKLENKEKKNIINSLISTIIGVIAPIIPILIGTGLGKCLLMIVSMMGWANADTSMTYYIFNFVFDAGFTFLPVFVAVAAAKHFKCNTFMAALLGCALVHPNWNSIVSAVDPKFIGSILGIFPVYGMSYTSSLIPAILVVWVMSKVEYGLNKYLPNMIKDILSPLLTLLIMVPLTFVVLAPAMGIVSIYLGNALLWIYNTFGMFALAILCIVYPWLVVTGMHSTLAIAGIQILSQSGYDPFSRTLTLTANMSQGAAAMACALKTKNKEFKQTCLSSGLTAFLGGITEPCIYGVTLKLKKPMYAVMIGCFSGGLYAGFVGLKAYAFMTPSIINIPMWIGGTSNSNLINAIITIIISAVVTFIATLVIGFDDPVEESNDINHNLMNNVKSPISGKILDLNSVNDEMFSKEVLGKGVALIPNDNKVYSPVEGIISATFETKHAIGITTDKNMEI